MNRLTWDTWNSDSRLMDENEILIRAISSHSLFFIDSQKEMQIKQNSNSSVALSSIFVALCGILCMPNESFSIQFDSISIEIARNGKLQARIYKLFDFRAFITQQYNKETRERERKEKMRMKEEVYGNYSFIYILYQINWHGVINKWMIFANHWFRFFLWKIKCETTRE